MRKRAAHSISAQREVERLRRDLEGLYLRADPRIVDDPELASDLGQYLCLRVAGFLEQATAVILRDFCSKNSWGPVQEFAHSWLDRMPNLSADALTKLIKRFNSSWAAEFEEFLKFEERKSSLNALVGIRNGVAHGRQQGLSRERAWEYFDVAERVVEWLLDKFEATSTSTDAPS
jgi:hypothetical protein